MRFLKVFFLANFDYLDEKIFLTTINSAFAFVLSSCGIFFF